MYGKVQAMTKKKEEESGAHSKRVPGSSFASKIQHFAVFFCCPIEDTRSCTRHPFERILTFNVLLIIPLHPRFEFGHTAHPHELIDYRNTDPMQEKLKL